jgi:hypothetical protein
MRGLSKACTLAARVLEFSDTMNGNIIVMPEPGRPDLSILTDTAGEMGWTVEVARNLDEVQAAQSGRKTVAILMQRGAFGLRCSWGEALGRVRSVSGPTRIVVCHGLGEPVDWQSLADAGAFHALALPLQENEVRQSLGFVWAAENRANEGNGLAMAADAVTGADLQAIRRLPSLERHVHRARAASGSVGNAMTRAVG